MFYLITKNDKLYNQFISQHTTLTHTHKKGKLLYTENANTYIFQRIWECMLKYICWNVC